MDKKDFIYFFVLFLCLVAIAGLFFYMKAETTQCLKNPYLYGASKMGDVSCSCTQGTGICPPRFSFNDTTFDAGVTICGTDQKKVYPDFKDLNLSFVVTP